MLDINLLTTSVPIIQKPVRWFAEETNWVVSIWWEQLVVKRLKAKFGDNLFKKFAPCCSLSLQTQTFTTFFSKFLDILDWNCAMKYCLWNFYLLKMLIWNWNVEITFRRAIEQSIPISKVLISLRIIFLNEIDHQNFQENFFCEDFLAVQTCENYTFSLKLLLLFWWRKVVYLLYGKLSNSTTTTLIIGRLPITNHFGNISNLFFPIKALTLMR